MFNKTFHLINATKLCLYSLLSTALLLSSAACNSKKEGPTTATDSTAKAVDANAQKAAAESENAEAEKSAAKGDLIAFQLMGNVKECKWTETEAQPRTYTFDENGHLTKVNNKAVNKVFTDIKRDEKGRLLSYTEDHPDEFYAENISYNYDAQDHLSKYEYNAPDYTCKTTYTYNDNGHVASVLNIHNYMDGGAEKEKITYNYVSFDKQGNWTKRNRKQDDGLVITETRTISYFK